MESPSVDPAHAVQRKQQLDAERRLPAASDVERVLEGVDQRAVIVEGRAVRLERPGMAVTLDGIGKGYVVDGGVAELNAVLFRSEYDDLQVNSFIVEEGQTIGLVQNAAETVNQGLEVDGRWAATEWLTLGGSVAWLDAEYEEYDKGTCSTTEQAAGLVNPCDKSGETPPYAPEFSGAVYADLVVPMGASLNFVANLTAYYSDEYFTEGSLDPAQEQDSYTRVSGRLGVEASDGKWDVSVIGRNLTEEEVLDVSQPWFGYNLGYIGAPRTITVQATYRFGN